MQDNVAEIYVLNELHVLKWDEKLQPSLKPKNHCYYANRNNEIKKYVNIKHC